MVGKLNDPRKLISSRMHVLSEGADDTEVGEIPSYPFSHTIREES